MKTEKQILEQIIAATPEKDFHDYDPTEVYKRIRELAKEGIEQQPKEIVLPEDSEGKKLYWQIKSNNDLSVTCNNLETCKELLTHDFNDLDSEGQHETEYTITSVYYTDEEYEKLPEVD